MTLNVTFITNAYVVQASDRRMVSMPGGQPIDEQANKEIVLQTEDGMFAITLCGVGRYQDQRVDMWLAETLSDEGVPEMPISRGLPIIAGRATDWFRTFTPGIRKHHTFTVAGWVTSCSPPRPAIWAVTNCAGANYEMLEEPSDQFVIVTRNLPRNRASFNAFGLHKAISRADRRRFQGVLRKGATADRAERALVEMIRSAARKPGWSTGINGEVLAVALSPGGVARATYYPTSMAAQNYAPLFVWHQAGHNFVAGDARIPNPSQFAYRFGQAMLVGKPGGATRQGANEAPDSEQIGFLSRISQAKFKRDRKGDEPVRDDAGQVPMVVVEMFPLTEEAQNLVMRS